MRRVVTFVCAFICFALICAGVPGSVAKVSASTAGTSPNASPAVIFEAESYLSLQNAMGSDAVPDIVLFSADDRGMVEFAGAEDETGYSIEQVCSLLEGKSIPAVTVGSEAEGEALKTFLGGHAWEDFYVVSSSADVLRSVRTAYPLVCGVLAADTRDLSAAGAGYALAGEACAALAQVVLLSETVSPDTVYEVQSRSVLAWIRTGDTQTDVWEAFSKGGYGIVNGDPSAVWGVLTSLSKDTVCRPSYIVGHRGYPALYNENSVEGVSAAYEAGASHTEIDIHITADGELVVIHDSTLDRTTDGTGNVETMRWEEISQYKLTDNADAEPSDIPLLSDMLAILREPEFENKLLVIEIKQNSLQLISALDTLLESYSDIRDRLVFISFYDAMISELAEQIPNIPRGYLGTLTAENYRSRLLPYNAFIDSDRTLMGFPSEDDLHGMIVSGYAVWRWTYSGEDVIVDIRNGFSGLTTDNVSGAAAVVSRFSAPQSVDKKDVSDNKHTVTAVLYGGTEEKVSAEFIRISDDTGVFKYTYETARYLPMVYYSAPVSVSDGGMGIFVWIVIGVGAAIVLAAGICVPVLVVRRKRRGARKVSDN